MKRIVLFMLPLLFFYTEFRAQTFEDSICISKINWTVTDISKGIRLKQAQVQNLYKGVQHISIIEVDTKNSCYKVGTHTPNGNTLTETSVQAQSIGALAAINGTYFDMKNGGDVNFHKMDNIILNSTDTSEFKIRAKGAICIANNKFSIIDWSKESESDSINYLAYDNILVSGPLLIYKSQIVTLEDDPFVNKKHPRSSVSITGNGNLMFVVFDGRHPDNADGVNLYELAHFLKQIGAYKALNLDGGGSSTLYAKGFGENGVANMPSDNKIFDHKGERKVSSIVYVK